jgi:hypothetical protein
MAFDIVSIVVQIVISIIFIAPVLWIAGRVLVGGKKAKFTDAIWIVTLGAVVGAVIGVLISGLIGALIQLIVWLYLVKHFFDCGWVKALAISIVAVVISVVILTILAALGLSLFHII